MALFKIKSVNTASLWISSVSFVLVSVIMYLLGTGIVYSTVIGFIIALVSFFVSRFFTWQFVLYRLKPLYRMITERSVSTAEMNADFANRDIIEGMGDELAQWAEKKSEEIVHLKAMENYRKEFMGNVSHELKTPLFTLQGYVLTLLDGGIHDEAINVRYLEKIEKNIDRLIAIVKDLEEISKLEINVMNLNREQFDIVAMAHEIADSMALYAQEAGITLKVTSDKEIDVFADKVRIEQVLINLISNSIKYGVRGGTTKISFIDMFDKVMIEVEDNGIGISRENLPRVFERFFRVDKSRSRENGGTGLGLSIVKHIVEAHGAQVNVRSELGKGSTFSFTLNKYL